MIDSIRTTERSASVIKRASPGWSKTMTGCLSQWRCPRASLLVNSLLSSSLSVNVFWLLDATLSMLVPWSTSKGCSVLEELHKEVPGFVRPISWIFSLKNLLVKSIGAPKSWVKNKTTKPKETCYKLQRTQTYAKQTQCQRAQRS